MLVSDSPWHACATRLTSSSPAEKFNKVPENVAQGKGPEPVKVTHDHQGTHGAGGGGSGGGIVGQEGSTDQSKTRHNDIVNGHPRRNGESLEEDDASELEVQRKPTGPDEAFAIWEREEMEELLSEVRGHLGES